MDQWKEFRIGDIFECSTTKLSIKDELDIWNIPLISRTAMNNWCDGYFDIDPQKVSKWGCITIGAEGIYAFYQAKDFWTWNKVYTIKNKEMNQYSALFICTLLNKEDYKYSYWRARILGKLINETIKLPVNPEWNPDREFMENYIKTLHSKPITTKNKPWKNVFHTDEWKEFRIGDLFDVVNGKWLTNEEIEENPGDIFCIQWWEWNNGSIGTINLEYCVSKSYIVLKQPCLTVARVGTAGCVNFWNSPCAIWDKCKALLLKTHWTKYTYLFLKNILGYLQYKYSYWRGLVTEKYLNEIIKLPVNSEWNPDREYMENYIKNLPYGDRI